MTTVWTTPADLAPWPKTEAEVTADSLARFLAVRAYARAEWAKANVDDSHAHHLASDAIAADLATVVLLEALSHVDEDQATLVAQSMWHVWKDGGEVREGLWWRLRDYGIDPEQISQLARA